MKNVFQTILFISIIFLPIFIFPQSITDSLSPESQMLLQQAKKSMKKPYISKNDMVNIALTTHFAGSIVYNDQFYKAINSITSVELFIGKNPARFLMTGRIKIPLLYSEYYYDNFVQYNNSSKIYLGLGIGTSINILDQRNQKGLGGLLAVNFLFTSDFQILSSSFNIFESQHAIDFEFRYSHFLAKRFAFIIGLGTSVGGNLIYISRTLGSDKYPITPLENYGETIVVAFSVGTTIGFMF